ncbi:HNH endonuclease [Leptospira meyeri]|uniref:HNH endonuclease n=1 Tax=Leptospira meyeri TaxID=29508 RepID=A0A4R8MVF5_LEPME|nr:HNH endonuclease [Leptospira meyeri]PKA22086.1 HNH endonuclease [Leptospira sp. mixed culture ATI2-C-A1]EKJ84855.1 HNH endonuclease domain protein [Leptospira meyeri serovar Hardjo str. Went 5]EMJ86040.1 HNH endonuclease domain protein [Leptospira meyeri serovar Semaranga str. Veldrot Semarang 173]MCW7489498.1 HNH endonuclease [Leptospira meyeri]PJZ82245.1 HNH endonuclease [Leptospira meyeri]
MTDTPSDSFFSDVSDEEIARERKKAKELKTSAWWKNKRSSGICHYCGKKFKVEELTMDHLIPLIRGGKSVKANLVPACKECNFKKKHSLPFEKEFFS